MMDVTIIMDEEGNLAVYLDGSELCNDLIQETATRRVTIRMDPPVGRVVEVPPPDQREAEVKA